MGKSTKLPAYRNNPRTSTDVVRKEFQKLEKNLESSNHKRRKWKRGYQDTVARYKKLENAVAQMEQEFALEKEEYKRRELFAKIQAHLDAWNFYHECNEEGV